MCGQQVIILVTPVSAQALKKDYTHQLTSDPTSQSATKSVVIQRCHTHKKMPPSQGVIQTNQPPNQLSWKGVMHTSQSATNSNAAHRGTVPTSAIDGKVPFEEQHACGLQSLDGPSNVDGSFYKTRQWGHQAPTMCWGGLAHPISSCTSTTAGSYAQPSVPFSTSV